MLKIIVAINPSNLPVRGWPVIKCLFSNWGCTRAGVRSSAQSHGKFQNMCICVCIYVGRWRRLSFLNFKLLVFNFTKNKGLIRCKNLFFVKVMEFVCFYFNFQRSTVWFLMRPHDTRENKEGIFPPLPSWKLEKEYVT